MFLVKIFNFSETKMFWIDLKTSVYNLEQPGRPKTCTIKFQIVICRLIIIGLAFSIIKQPDTLKIFSWTNEQTSKDAFLKGLISPPDFSSVS